MLFTTVNLTIHGLDEAPSITDYVDDNGRFVNIGVQVAAALTAKKTIHFMMDGTEVIVPYHAVVTYSILHEEEPYTKPDDDFCKSESTPTDDGIVLLDGTYEFEDEEGIGFYNALLDKCYSPEDVTVTVDGTTVTLPKFADGEYGEFDEDDDAAPVFTTYPAAVVLVLPPSGDGMMLVVSVPTAGSHTVKVTVPDGSEAECGK